MSVPALEAEQANGALAQLGEHLLCKQGVIGSIPIGSTSLRRVAASAGEPAICARKNFPGMKITSFAGSPADVGRFAPL